MNKILLNGLQLKKENSGVQYYTEYLFNEIIKIKPSHLDIEIIKDDNPTNKNVDKLRRIIYENFYLNSYFKQNKFDLYHSPNYIIPRLLNRPSVVTIHDLITLDYPELCQYKSVIYFNLFLSSTIHKAKKIITVSNTVKSDIIKHFNVDEKRIEVIHLGIDSIFKKTIDIDLLQRYNLPEKYILFVGNIEGKKNLTRLILAYKDLLFYEKISHKLVLVGKKGWKSKSVYKTILKFNLKDHIIFTGYVPKEDLPPIYSMSDLFVFPSIYEGFGIPPLEAMACGVPVLVSKQGASPEICGNACLQVNPFSIDEIANGIDKLINNKLLRKQNIDLGKEWVKQFTWKKAAEKTLKVYEEALYN